MANIKDNVAIRIFNYNPFNLSIPTNITTHTLKPCYDLNNPTSDRVSFAELVNINSRSSGIRNGLISFAEEDKKDVYEALNIIEWEKILSNDEIKDIIINPNKEKLQKIIDINDQSVLDRVVCIYMGLFNGGEYDISNRVTNIINLKRDEFRKGLTVSHIQLRNTDDKLASANEDIETVKKQNANLQEQLNQMQAMMAQLIASQNVMQTEKVGNTDTPKRPGRPSKETKN